MDNNYAEQLLDEVLSQNSGLSSSFRSSLSSQTDLRMKEEEERDKTPPWIRWSHSLEELLDDSAGFELFRKYLEDNDVVDVLWFYFAVKGMRKQTMANMEMQKRQKLLLSIYTRFVQSIALQLLPQTRQSLDRYFSSGQSDKSDFHIFDEAQQEVLQLMRNNLHQNFLNSDLYIDFVNQQVSSLPCFYPLEENIWREKICIFPKERLMCGRCIAKSDHIILVLIHRNYCSLCA